MDIPPAFLGIKYNAYPPSHRYYQAFNAKDTGFSKANTIDWKGYIGFQYKDIAIFPFTSQIICVHIEELERG